MSSPSDQTSASDTKKPASSSNATDANNKKKGLPTPQHAACAACKFQRRRCAPNCPLARYFPAENQREFLNAHRLFGVNNMVKWISKLQPNQRDDAMKAIIFTANARARDPVGGCYRMVKELQAQYEQTKAQYVAVKNYLDFFKSQVSSQPPLLYDGFNGLGLQLGADFDPGPMNFGGEGSSRDGDVKPDNFGGEDSSGDGHDVKPDVVQLGGQLLTQENQNRELILLNSETKFVPNKKQKTSE